MRMKKSRPGSWCQWVWGLNYLKDTIWTWMMSPDRCPQNLNPEFLFKKLFAPPCSQESSLATFLYFSFSSKPKLHFLFFLKNLVLIIWMGARDKDQPFGIKFLKGLLFLHLILSSCTSESLCAIYGVNLFLTIKPTEIGSVSICPVRTLRPQNVGNHFL